MANEKFIIEVEIDASNAEQSMRNLTNAVGTAATTSGNADLTQLEKNLAKTATNSNRAAAGTRQLNQSLSTTRYALYDVSYTLGIVGAALLALPAASLAAAISFERDFANVTRTTGVTGDAISELRRELVNLSATTPVAFSDIAEISTLGGQLGIEAEGITDFTSVVARLTATTNLSAEAAGTALGRFQALLGVPSSEFENLASAILKVGVNSVATETQIVSIATQISSMADFAGLSADEVVGLAGALASVGAQPELSRGTITRVFTQMSRAIASGGERLEEFGRLSGITGEQFAEAFGTDQFGGVFQDFLTGIGEEGQNAISTLNELGITSVRDVPLLQRLALANDVVRQSFADAASGYETATILQEQYGITSQTTAARIQTLVGAVTALFDSIGSNVTGPLADFISFLTDATNAARAFLETDFGQNTAIALLVFTTLLGTLALLGAAFAGASAGAIALRQGVSGLAGVVGAYAGASNVATAATSRFAASATAASIGVKTLTVAMRALSLVGLALLLPDLGSFASDTVRAARGLDSDLVPTLDRVREAFSGGILGEGQFGFGTGALGSLSADMAAFGRSLGNLDTSSGQGLRDIKELDETLAELAVTNGPKALLYLEDLRKQFIENGGSQAAFNELFTDTVDALSDTSQAAIQAAQSAVELAEAEDYAAERAAYAAEAMGLTAEEYESFVSAIQSGSSAFFDWASNVDEAFGEAGGGIQQFIGTLGEQIDAQTDWANDIGILSARGADAFVSQIAAMGPDSAELAKQAVDLSADELYKLEEQARLAAFLASDALAESFTANLPALVAAFDAGGIEAVQALIAAQTEEARTGVSGAVDEFYSEWNKANKNNQLTPIPVTANTNPAREAVRRLIRDSKGTVIGVRVGAGITSRTALASGGPVVGPGTGTSDSISARLSNGEYVIRAASVRKYGTGMFDQLNRGVAKFANGGYVGPQRFANGGLASNSGGGVVELGPKSLGVLRRGLQADLAVSVGTEQIARAASSGSRSLQARGSN